MSDEEITKYLDNMYGADAYQNLDDKEKERLLFSAKELLTDFAGEKQLTPRVVALQMVYMAENTGGEFQSLRENNVQSYSVKGVSITFNDSVKNGSFYKDGGGLIAPIVLGLLKPRRQASVARLI